MSTCRSHSYRPVHPEARVHVSEALTEDTGVGTSVAGSPLPLTTGNESLDIAIVRHLQHCTQLVQVGPRWGAGGWGVRWVRCPQGCWGKEDSAARGQSCSDGSQLRNSNGALARWLCWLECHPGHQKAVGSIPG